MQFRSILCAALAALLMSGTAGYTRDTSMPQPHQGARGAPIPRLDIGVMASRHDEGTYQVAQAATDPRVVALEEQVRALNGTIEELNFQVLQLQEQIRKMQEDNEFRFQELEKKSDAGATKTDRKVTQAPAANDNAAANSTSDSSSTVEDVIGQDQAGATEGTGEAPKTFGVLTVDGNGNVVDESNPNGTSVADGTTVAALPNTDDPEELYRNAYQFILSGDYGTAETGFRDHIARFPKDTKAADAHFWLGEALLGQKKYRDAAETFLAANKDYPKSKKAPDMLLKLGISLVGLNQKDVACATFGEVGKRYPDASSALKERVKQERALAAC